jgi:hypothetical protein
MRMAQQEWSRGVGGTAGIANIERIDWQITPIINDLTTGVDSSFPIEERAAEIIRAIDSDPKYWSGEDAIDPNAFFANFALSSLKYLSRSRILHSLLAGKAETQDFFSAYRMNKIAATAGHLSLVEMFDQYRAIQSESDPVLFEELLHVARRAEAAVVNGHHKPDRIKVDSEKFVRGVIGEWQTGDVLVRNGVPIRRATPKEDARGMDLFARREDEEKETSIQVRSCCGNGLWMEVLNGERGNRRKTADVTVKVHFPEDRGGISFTRTKRDTKEFLGYIRSRTKRHNTRKRQTYRRPQYSPR